MTQELLAEKELVILNIGLETNYRNKGNYKDHFQTKWFFPPKMTSMSIENYQR